MSKIKILFFGDIFGKIGRQGIIKILPNLKKKYQPDFIVANVENLAHGRGITKNCLQEMLDAGINFFTSGNHVWDKPDAYDILAQKDAPIIRPANYPEETVGQGEKIVKIGSNSLLMINLMGTVFFTESFSNPFLAMDEILAKYATEKLAGIILDFHAEATSEKVALGYYLDGRISAVIGTHTHVQTADEKILAQGTAYITDLGMSGAKESIIGLAKKEIIDSFIKGTGLAAEIPETGICQINAIYLEIDPKTQKALKIERIFTEVEV